jgi:hypothetical protein
MVRMIALISLLVSAFVFGCGGSTASRSLPPPATGSVWIRPWPGAKEPLWPTTARRVQVVVTPYDADYLVWIVSNGTIPLAVYYATQSQHGEIYARIGQQQPAVMELLQLRTRNAHHRVARQGSLCSSCRVAPLPRPPDNLYAWQQVSPTSCYTSGPTCPGGPVGEPPPPEDASLVFGTTTATNSVIPNNAP